MPARRSKMLDAVIDDLVDANRILAREGVVDGFGHVSARHPENPARYLLSRNVAPEQVTRADIMEFDLDSNPLDAKGRQKDRQPYRERFIHGEIYKARADVSSVINAHSPWVLSFAANGIPLRPIHNKAAFLAPGTPIFDMRLAFGATDMLLTTPAQGAALAQALGSSAVILLRGHGHVAVGPSLKVTVFRAYYAEFNARLQARSMALPGTTVYLEGEEATMSDRTMQQVDERAWALWKSRVRRQSAKP
jgi:ribulose-5-phosphate 4-epimerase/fuculose-1-phosphate aldolase